MPFNSVLPTKPLKHVAALRGEKVDSVPADGEYIGLEQIDSGTGRLSDIELQQQPEGTANVFNDGDVLFGKLRPYLAKGWAADRAGYCTTEALVLRPRDADARFVRYCVLAAEFVDAVNGSTYGSKMPRADWSFVGAVQVPCPTKSVQERIANFLDEQTARIDALIAEKERLASSVRAYEQAEISRLLTHGVSDAPLEKTGKPFIPEAPAGWRVTAFKRALISMGQGWSPQCESQPAQPGEWGVLKVGCVNGTKFDANENKALPAELQPDMTCVLRKGDVLMSRANTKELVGMTALVDDDYPQLMLCDKLYRLELKQDWVLPEYAVLALRSDCSRRQIELGASGASSSMQNISQDVVRELLVAFPSLDEQRAIVDKASQIREACGALAGHVTQHIDSLREYRSSLISAAVTGQLDLSTFKKAVQ